MKSFVSMEFKAHIVRERSITPVLEKLGQHTCTMDLYVDEMDIDPRTNRLEPSGSGTIEWVIGDEEEVEHIGVWWEGRKLTDYDGVFSLNPYAVKLLRKAGITVGKDFLP
jgi:hypothetical protein